MSTPGSPGASSPTTFANLATDDLKVPEIEPPARPKSTPFPKQEMPTISLAIRPTSNATEGVPIPLTPEECNSNEMKITSTLTFTNLPHEIHEYILDHIFGVRASTVNISSSSRGWSSALRHSRRKQLSDVALISRTYKGLIQARIFKHSTPSTSYSSA